MGSDAEALRQKILRALVFLEPATTPGLAEVFGVSRGRVHRALLKLEEDGDVVRQYLATTSGPAFWSLLDAPGAREGE